MLSHSRNVLINGNSVVLNSFQGEPNQTRDRALEILYDYVARGALHNSGERFPPPQCHPKTRTAIQDEIMAWLDDLQTPYSVMWMRGAAGAGKSAVAQTIAEICYSHRRLCASFFFNRTSTTGRSSNKKLVATLAYQMYQNIPELQSHISSTILSNRLLFDLTIETQVKELLVEPLCHLSEASDTQWQPMLIIIDGLDECMNTDDAQAHIVRVFVAAITRVQHCIPHKLLIASRPESCISSVFRKREIGAFVRHLPLDDAWRPDDDIRTFLLDKFADIRRTHPLKKIIGHDWPAKGEIDQLVAKSSGQFIYAAVVIDYIQSNRDDPVHRLNVILKLAQDTKNRPYAELDALYMHLFSNFEHPDAILRILRLYLILSFESTFYLYGQDNVNAVGMVLGLSKAKLELVLSELCSLIVVNYGELVFLHASLSDFLMDEMRSGLFYADNEKLCLEIAQCCLKYMSEDRSRARCPSAALLSLRGLLHFTSLILPESRAQIYQGLSNINFLAFLVCEHRVADYENKHHLGREGGNFLRWILTDNKDIFPSEASMTLIQEWLLAQFRSFPFNGFDHEDDLDFWIYASASHLGATVANRLSVWWKVNAAGRTNMIKFNDLLKLVTPPVEFCWEILPYLTHDCLHDSDFLGLYSLTKLRYSAAALCLCRLFSNSPESFYIFGQSPSLANALAVFLYSATPDRDIYLLLCPTVECQDAEMHEEDDPPPVIGDEYRIYGYIWKQYPYRYIDREHHLQHRRAFAMLANAISFYIDEYHHHDEERKEGEQFDSDEDSVSDEGFETASEW